MLTVVGIIAVLVSVSIPVINHSLKKAQEATDAANERAAKGAALTEYISTGKMSAEEPAADADGYLYYNNAAGKWTAAKPTSYGKCKEHEHQSCYLKGKMNSSGEVEIKWTTNGTDEKQPLCSETLMADSGGGSTPEVPAGNRVGGFYVQGTEGTDYSFDDGVLTIISGEEITISSGGEKTDNRIVVANNVAANITLEKVNIDVSAKENTAAFMIADNSYYNVALTLKGKNILKSGSGCAGLQKNAYDEHGTGTLTIEGTGELIATGGSWAAGIGGGSNQECGHITIRSGIVNATGNAGGAGIGGGSGGAGNNIHILGGIVNATGEGDGAGIGGGCNGAGNIIDISGADVTAICKGGGGAGIGGGGGAGAKDGNNITISNSIVKATGGIYGGAGIGGGGDSGTGQGYGRIINISDSEVAATGNGGGAGIGGGMGGGGSNITISKSTVTATSNHTEGGSSGEAIGCGTGILYTTHPGHGDISVDETLYNSTSATANITPPTSGHKN